MPVPAGSVIHVLSGGGGGWGDPAARDPGARAADEAEGLTSAGARSFAQDGSAAEIV